MVPNKFYKDFGLRKLKWKEPAREVDADGNICAWYINEDYPWFTDEVIVDLIAMLGGIQGNSKQQIVDNLVIALTDKLNRMKDFGKNSEDSFIQSVQDCFECVYMEYEDED